MREVWRLFGECFVRADILKYPSKLIIFNVDQCKYELWPQLIINVAFNDYCSYYIYNSPLHLLRYSIFFLGVRYKKLKSDAFLLYPIINFMAL